MIEIDLNETIFFIALFINLRQAFADSDNSFG